MGRSHLAIAATGGVLVMVGCSVVWPAVLVGVDLIGSIGDSGPWGGVSLGLLGRSAGVALLIAVLACTIGWPAAWALRRAGAGWFVVLVSPLLLPSYLAYSGWGVLRAPDTVVGKWLMMGARDAAGLNRWSLGADYVLAVGGLVLWSWPLAALVCAVRLRRVDESVFEAMRLDVRSRAVRMAKVGWMCRGSIGAAAGLVGLVMLGSALPLHLAKLDTYAIKIWRVLDESPQDQRAKVWMTAWPLLLAAGLGAVVVARRLVGADGEEQSARPRRGGVGGMEVSAAVVWGLSVAAPVVLFAAHVRQWSVMRTFLRVSVEPLENSLTVAGILGMVVCVVTGWTWAALGGRGWIRRVGVAVLVTFLFSGLTPGILVGIAEVRAWNRGAVWWVGDSLAIVVLGHVARFGMVGALAGWWLAATENWAQRDMRLMDVGGSVVGWVKAALVPQVGVMVAAGLVAGLLSFHEIELGVMVQPPSGSGGSFAWLMLQWLHYSRMDDLGAGVMLIVGVGAMVGLAVVLLLRVGRGRRLLG